MAKKKPAMTPRDAMQLKAQKAVQAIATSDETRETRLADLARIRRFLDTVWTEVSDEAPEEEAAA